MRSAVHVPSLHLQRMQHDRLRGGEPFVKPVRVVNVQQETDAAPMHAIDRHAFRQITMQRLQHKTVTAERYDDLGEFRRDARI